MSVTSLVEGVDHRTCLIGSWRTNRAHSVPHKRLIIVNVVAMGVTVIIMIISISTQLVGALLIRSSSLGCWATWADMLESSTGWVLTRGQSECRAGSCNGPQAHVLRPHKSPLLDEIQRDGGWRRVSWWFSLIRGQRNSTGSSLLVNVTLPTWYMSLQVSSPA